MAELIKFTEHLAMGGYNYAYGISAVDLTGNGVPDLVTRTPKSVSTGLKTTGRAISGGTSSTNAKTNGWSATKSPTSTATDAPKS